MQQHEALVSDRNEVQVRQALRRDSHRLHVNWVTGQEKTPGHELAAVRRRLQEPAGWLEFEHIGELLRFRVEADGRTHLIGRTWLPHHVLVLGVPFSVKARLAKRSLLFGHLFFNITGQGHTGIRE